MGGVGVEGLDGDGAGGLACLVADRAVVDDAARGGRGEQALGILDFDVAPHGGLAVDLVVGEEAVLGNFEV